jgi:hypothetical protein
LYSSAYQYDIAAELPLWADAVKIAGVKPQ